MKQTVYSSKTLTIFKIFSIMAIIILVISNTIRLYSLGFCKLIENKFELITFVINCVSIILFFIFSIYPSKLGFASILSFIYGTVIIVMEPDNEMGILMYWLAVLILCARGYFNKHKKIKFSMIYFIFAALIFSEIRFGIDIFFKSLFEKLSYSFIIFLCTYFFYAYMTDKLDSSVLTKKLDLEEFPELKKRDAEWLAKIINGEKYESIAIEYKMSVGSVKNRLKTIFDELNTGDKNGFLNKYSEYTICYGDYFSFSKI